MKNKLLLSTLILTVLLTLGTLTVNKVSADFEGNQFTQRIAEKFGLNEDEVDGFMQEMHEQHRQEMEIAREEKLNQAVSDGVITDEQRQALEEKWAEQFAKREQDREEMQAWFEEQGIDHDALMKYGGFAPKGFSRHGMGMGQR